MNMINTAWAFQNIIETKPSMYIKTTHSEYNDSQFRRSEQITLKTFLFRFSWKLIFPSRFLEDLEM